MSEAFANFSVQDAVASGTDKAKDEVNKRTTRSAGQ
jgi:hypothetical protein